HPTALGSDGTVVPLTATNPTPSHPKLGVTLTTAVLTAGRDGTRPAIRTDASWTSGREITVDGRPFSLKDGVWTASADTTLDGSNTPAMDRIVLSDGTSHPIAWNTPEASDGRIAMTGTSAGETGGQRWLVTVTASRTPDRTRLDQAIAAGRAKLDDRDADRTADSVRTLRDAIAAAAALDPTATDDETRQAADRIDTAMRNLTDLTWSVRVDGRDVPLTRTAPHVWSLTADAATRPVARLTATSNDPTLDPAAMDGETKTRDDATRTLGVLDRTGTTTYRHRSAGRTLTVALSWRQTVGTPVALPGGVAAHRGTDGVWTATITGTLDPNGRPDITSLDLGGQSAKVTYSDPSGATGGTLRRTGLAEGELRATGQRYRITVNATTPIDTGELRALAARQRRAMQPGAHHWHAKDAEAMTRLLDETDRLLKDDGATPAAVTDLYARLNRATLTATAWTVDGRPLTWHEQEDA
ncbi:cell surface protein, partial [Bifidobacterium margollesii]